MAPELTAGVAAGDDITEQKAVSLASSGRSVAIFDGSGTGKNMY